ncbi:MAG: polyphenol oxidase family protein [Solirubrobacteraceae bacterium]
MASPPASTAGTVELSAPFRWAGEHIGCVLPGGRALFTTRRGGVSAAPYDTLNLGGLTDDDGACVRANRDRLAALTSIAWERTLQGMQVHETDVRRVRELPEASAALEPADGQATALAGVAAVVLTADCLPVVLVSDGAVAAVHAGWRGLAGGILAEGVRALRDLGAAGAVRAAIGPGAGVCCYETGPEVHAAFASYGAGARDGDHADLKHVARRQLEQVGVAEIHDVGLCTLCAPRGMFFSHRRDGAATGRQAGVVWREHDGRAPWPS